MIFQDPMTSLNPFLTRARRQLTEVLQRRTLDMNKSRGEAVAPPIEMPGATSASPIAGQRVETPIRTSSRAGCASA